MPLGARTAGALIATDGVAAQPVRKRSYKIIPIKEGFTIPETLRARPRNMKAATDEPGIGWSWALGRVQGGTDWSHRVSETERHGLDMRVMLLGAPSVQIFGADQATALARLGNDFTTEVPARKYSGGFALLATVAP